MRKSAWALLGLLALACSSSEEAVSPPAEPRLPVSLPATFRMGFATVAYQSEGTMKRDGTRVSSNWSEWEDLGKVKDAQHNDRGNGFFDHYTVDLDNAASVGANSFSYAIDWARLEPQPGVFDDEELTRIVDMVKAMRARNLRPLLVLFHWVTPSWVQSPKTGLDLLAQNGDAFVNAFLPLIDHVVPPLAGLVDDWVTFEEPYSIVLGEYLSAEHPPGHILDLESSKNALVNLAHLHGRTYKALKRLDTQDADGDGVTASVGVENLAIEVAPADDKDEDDRAAAAKADYIVNRQFINSIVRGDIDLDMDEKPEMHEDELVNTLDWIGLNYYQRIRVGAGGPLFGLNPINDTRAYATPVAHSDMYQEIDAAGLRHQLEAYAKYKLPMVVTETGIADADDDQRAHYLVEHLYTVARAAADGIDVRGFYCWTISDNFEWSEGVDARFGVFRVDFTKPDFPRTRLASADAYSDLAHTRTIDRALWDRWTASPYPEGIP